MFKFSSFYFFSFILVTENIDKIISDFLKKGIKHVK